jgi:hypothetical protein
MVPGCAQCAKNPRPVKALTIAVVAETHDCPMYCQGQPDDSPKAANGSHHVDPGW